MATNSASIVNPDSEQKLHCVKWGLWTKSCTQSTTQCTSWSGMATRSRLIENLSPRLQAHGPQVLLIEKPETSHFPINKRSIWTIVTHHTWWDTTHTLCRFCRARKRICAEQKNRTSPTSGRLLVDAAVPARRTSTQPWTLQLICLLSTPSLIADPWACWKTGIVRRHLHQLQLQG